MTNEIIMCVYNGEKYIETQLLSILRQTRKIDSMTIYDDCSSDNTREIINNFITDNNITDWRLIVNETNKGWRRSFYDAILDSTADIVFFADQDDVWSSDKIEIMSAAIENNSDILALSGEINTIDGDGKVFCDQEVLSFVGDINYTPHKETFKENCQGYSWKHRIGCAIAFTREMRELIKVMPYKECFAHDLAVVNIAAILDRYYVVDFISMSYRLHNNNASIGNKSFWVDAAGYSQYLLDFVSTFSDRISQEAYKFLVRFVKFAKIKDRTFAKFAPFSHLRLLAYFDCYADRKMKKWIGDGINAYKLRSLLRKLRIVK